MEKKKGVNVNVKVKELVDYNKDVNVNVKVKELIDYNSIINHPYINDVEVVGHKTAEDYGLSPDKHYVHEQGISEQVWTIEHNLGKHPSVTVVDSAGNEVIGQVYYQDLNTCVVYFTSKFSGKAYLN